MTATAPEGGGFGMSRTPGAASLSGAYSPRSSALRAPLTTAPESNGPAAHSAASTTGPSTKGV